MRNHPVQEIVNLDETDGYTEQTARWLGGEPGGQVGDDAAFSAYLASLVNANGESAGASS